MENLGATIYVIGTGGADRAQVRVYACVMM